MKYINMQLTDIDKISDIVKNHGLLLDPADPTGLNQYRFVNYLPLGSVQFVALLDRQVVSYLLELLKTKNIQNEVHEKVLRATAALQAFLIVTNTHSEPGLSFNEYIDSEGLDKADIELSLFRSADEVGYEIYSSIALGQSHSIPSKSIRKFPTCELKSVYKNQKVRDFEYNLTTVKKALLIKQKGACGFESILELYNWLHDDYIWTTPSMFFFAIYFSSHSISNMLKNNSEKAARNAAWDLCMLQQWRKNMSTIQADRILLVSFDKAIKSIARLMFPSSDESSEEMHKRINIEFVRLYGKSGNKGQKVYNRFFRLFQETNDSTRACNQKGNRNSHDFILRVRAKVDAEFENYSAIL
jgi:hypothetical protein